MAAKRYSKIILLQNVVNHTTRWLTPAYPLVNDGPLTDGSQSINQPWKFSPRKPNQRRQIEALTKIQRRLAVLWVGLNSRTKLAETAQNLANAGLFGEGGGGRRLYEPRMVGLGVQRRLAPEEGFEPPTRRLTAACSTTELLRTDEGSNRCRRRGGGVKARSDFPWRTRSSNDRLVRVGSTMALTTRWSDRIRGRVFER